MPSISTTCLDEMKQAIGDAREQFSGEIRQFAVASGKPLEEASKKSGETIDGLSGRMVRTLETVSEQLVHEGERLTKSTASIVTAIDAVVSKLESLQTPDRIIEIELAPMVQSLSGVVSSFSKSAEAQAKAIDANLKQTHDVAVAMTQLMQEIRAAESARFSRGPWGASRHEG